MVPKGDEAQVDACFGPFGESANLDANRCMVCIERTIRRNHYWTHLMDPLGDVGHVECRFSSFGDSVSLSAR
jgi:hypothetical protein